MLRSAKSTKRPAFTATFTTPWRSTTTLFGILDGEHTVIDGNYDFLKPYYEQVLSRAG